MAFHPAVVSHREENWDQKKEQGFPSELNWDQKKEQGFPSEELGPEEGTRFHTAAISQCEERIRKDKGPIE